MDSRGPFFVLLLSGFLLSTATAGATPSISRTTIAEAYPGQGDLVFTQNLGQWPEHVLFRAEAGGAAIWLSKDGMFYELRTAKSTGELSVDSSGFQLSGDPERALPPAWLRELVRVHFEGAKVDVQVEGYDLLPQRYNYFLGADPDRWRSGVPGYARVKYTGLYDGIDLEFYGSNGQLEYDIIVAPGADPAVIRMEYDSAHPVTRTSDRHLQIAASLGTISERIPHVYALGDFTDLEPECRYVQLSARTFGFELSVDRDVQVAWVIDPVVSFSTFLGGSGIDEVRAIDASYPGRIVTSGRTSSADFPILDAYQPTSGGSADVMITAMTSDGNQLLFSTYFGGSQSDVATDIQTDDEGRIHVSGITSSPDLPTENPLQDSIRGSTDFLVAKFSTAGDSLIFSTYLGGRLNEIFYPRRPRIGLDSDGFVYVAGEAGSDDFPVKNGYQMTYQGTADGVLVKLSPDGDSLIYGTYLGGSGTDGILGLHVDEAGYAYVSGVAVSSNFPLVNPLVNNFTLGDAFLAKFNPAGNGLEFSTYVEGLDYAADVGLDATGNIWIVGRSGGGATVVNPYFATPQGSNDMYLAKYTNAGDALLAGTYFGGGSSDLPHALAVRPNGNPIVAGFTEPVAAPPFPSTPLNVCEGSATYRREDACLFELTADGSSLVFSTIMGSRDDEEAFDVGVDAAGAIYGVGRTTSSNFPTLNPLYSYQGGVDGFIVKLSSACTVLNTGDVNLSCDLTSADIIGLVNYTFKSGLEPEPCAAAGDVTCDGSVNSADIIWMVNYVFKGGSPPCDVCAIIPSVWACP